MTKACPHLKTIKNARQLKIHLHSRAFQAKLDSEELECGMCDFGLPSLWLCLEDGCEFIGCGRRENAHSLRHAKQTADTKKGHEFGHCLCINLRTLAVWCYGCDDEILEVPDSNGVDLREIVQKATEKKPEQNKASAATSGTLLSGLRGYPNYGNTCYANSALQALSNVVPFRRYFEQMYITNSHASSPRATLVNALASLMCSQWRDSGHRSIVDTPLKEVISSIGYINPTFRGFQQQDSQEFLRCLLDSVHEEVRREVTHPDAIKERAIPVEPDSDSDSDDDSPQQRTVWDSVVQSVFGGTLLSQVTCHSCGKVSRKWDPFFDISVSIPNKKQRAALENGGGKSQGSGWFSGWFGGKKGVTLESCLQLYTSSELLTGKEQYRCSRCKTHRDASKELRIDRLPETMCIQLKRFRYDTFFGSKVSTHVTFPDRGLDMTPFLAPQTSDDDGGDPAPPESHPYDLVAVVNHHGSLGGGHYTAYGKNTDGEWYLFDDSRVSRTSIETVLSSQAYLLVYQQRPSEETLAARRSLQYMLHEDLDGEADETMEISREWLFRALNHSSSPGPVTNTDIICEHGVASARHVPNLIQRAHTVSSDLYQFSVRLFRGGPDINKLEETCPKCDKEEDDLRARSDAERAAIGGVDSREIEEGELWYVINARWLALWRKFALGETLEVPGPVNNSALMRGKTDELRPNLKSHRDYKFVNERVWELFMEYYGGGPAITRPDFNLYE